MGDGEKKLRYLIHEEVGWTYRVVVVDNNLIIVQGSARDHLRENLTPD